LEHTYQSVFEPTHGSGVDLASHGIANPARAFWTAAMMLRPTWAQPSQPAPC
jgi:isocitrate/isopropylmalate dehydrogenase